MARSDEEGLAGDVINRAAGAARRGENGVRPFHDLDALDREWVDVALRDVVKTIDGRAVDLEAAHRDAIESVGQRGFGDAGDILQRIKDAHSPDIFQQRIGDDVDRLRRIEDGGAKASAAGHLGGLVAVRRRGRDFERVQFYDLGRSGRWGLGVSDCGSRQCGEECGREGRSEPRGARRDQGRGQVHFRFLGL